MYYEIRRIEIPLESGKLIEFKALHLCKIIECVPNNNWYIEDMKKPLDERRESLYVVVMERWGQNRGTEKTHKLVMLQVGERWEFMPAYEPTLSRRGKFSHRMKEYYVFQV